MGSLAMLFLLNAAACSTPRHAQTPRFTDEDTSQARKIFAGIDERNRTEKRSESWLRSAYSGIKIKNLSRVEEKDLARYRQYVDRSAVYVIVHPGYFPFVDTLDFTPPPMSDPKNGYPGLNLADRYEEMPYSSEHRFRTAKEQERILRDFLEYTSVVKVLVILVLPKDYANHMTYGTGTGFDEYARYINELTNMSDNIVFIESQSHDNGIIEDRELDNLTAFFEAIGVNTVYMGGGYLGRCLDGSYQSLRQRIPYDRLFIVPEITAISPQDMADDKITLVTGSGRLNFKALRRYYKTIGFSRDKAEQVRLFPLPFYSVYKVR